jgi:hypothetical protein
MPYISKEQRSKLDSEIDSLCSKLSGMGVGDYNYVITRLIHNYIKENGLRYEHLNSAVGILECAKAEFIRAVVNFYEDQKRAENSPISEIDGKI